jgi:hypothetical protein
VAPSAAFAADTYRTGESRKWVRRGTRAEPATVQHNLSVAKDTSPTTSATTATTVLRWKTPQISRSKLHPAAQPAGNAISVSSLLESGGTVKPLVPFKRKYPVRTVSFETTGEPDPFQDPFGDGQPTEAPTEAPPQEPPPAFDAPAQPPAGNLPPPAQVDPLDTPPDPPRTSDFPDDLDDLNGQTSEPCDRVYNERDCCEEEENCNDARANWQRDSISKISLDITPNIKPDAETPEEEESTRVKRLARSPVRTWRDEQGNVLGAGRVTNIKRGKLLILNANNEVEKIAFDRLSEDDLCFLTSWWGVPMECKLSDEQFAGRHWMPQTLTWKASGLCHKPLYFEEVQLERYGHTAGPIRQPLLSGAHFFINLFTVPYQAGINPPWECRYALGYYRPGNCAPYLVPPVPLSVRGGLWQAGAILGGVYLIP